MRFWRSDHRTSRNFQGARKMVRPGVILALGLATLLSASDARVRIDASVLATSIKQGRRFLLKNQTEAGYFHYEFDCRTLAPTDSSDSPTRQAGALWGLASIHRYQPTPETEAAMLAGFRFFQKHMQTLGDGRRYLVYPGTREQGTGALALLCLAYIDFLRAGDGLSEERKQELRGELKGALAFLLSLRRDDGQFFSRYSNRGRPHGKPSPYYDGESLLCLAKAVRYAGFTELRPLVRESAERMYQQHVVQARRRHPDSRITKGFYQWGSMAFHEMVTGGRRDVQVFTRRTIELGYWMIDTHHVLRRTRNTAYAFEGLACAYDLARRAGSRKATAKFRAAILVGLGKLVSWQVGGPAPNPYLQSLQGVPARSIGGVLNHRREPILRIDVTQHQMHACILAREYLFPGSSRKSVNIE